MSDAPCEPTRYGPCGPYLTVDDLTGCGCTGLEIGTEEDPGADRELAIEAIGWATRRVFVASGYRFWGCCEATIRPCRQSCAGLAVGGAFPSDWPWAAWPWAELPSAWASGFVPVWACSCPAGDPCSCSAWDRIPLPMLPARDVVSVQIGADTLDPSHYLLYAEGWLLRVDGDPWPSCQAIEAPLGQPGTWGITYRHGLDLPPEAKPLVGIYACELAKRCLGGDCALPEGVRVVRRDGVEFAVTEPDEYRAQGLTGFGPVDDWIALINGGHVQEPPRIYRPGREAPAPMVEYS